MHYIHVLWNSSNIGWDLRGPVQTNNSFFFSDTQFLWDAGSLCGALCPEIHAQCVAFVFCITYLNHSFRFTPYKKKYCNILKPQAAKLRILSLHFPSITEKY